jgi:hypothetical protein
MSLLRLFTPRLRLLLRLRRRNPPRRSVPRLARRSFPRCRKRRLRLHRRHHRLHWLHHGLLLHYRLLRQRLLRQRLSFNNTPSPQRTSTPARSARSSLKSAWARIG